MKAVDEACSEDVVPKLAHISIGHGSIFGPRFRNYS